MRLSEALEGWLGPLASHGAAEPTARAIFLGAGFTKAAYDPAPLFGEYAPHLRDFLLDAQTTLPETLRAGLKKDRDDKKKRGEAGSDIGTTDLIDLLDLYFQRRTVADWMFSEPLPGQALWPRAWGPTRRSPPPFHLTTYRTFDEWKQLLAAPGGPWSEILDLGGPSILLARLVAERAVPLILSTNWDAFVETGCWLAGLQVQACGERSDEDVECVDVYDEPFDVELRPHSDRTRPLLLKLHGSVGAIRRAISVDDGARPLPEEIDRRLKECFLVATTDLTHWRGSSQWVADAVASALRSHSTLFVGVSGADPVTFRAVKERVERWESARRQCDEDAAHHRHDGRGKPREEQPLYQERAPLFAIDRSDKPRLHGLFAFRTGRRREAQVVQAAGRPSMRAAWAWWLARRLVRALQDSEDGRDHRTADCLIAQLECELNSPTDAGESPLVDLLCDALAPNLRFAALAAGRPPFDRRAEVAQLDPWRHASWAVTPEGWPPVEKRRMRIIARAVAALALRGAEVDRSEGTVRVRPGNWGLPLLEDRDLLLWPWPWPRTRDLDIPGLIAHLRRLTITGSPTLAIVPLPALWLPDGQPLWSSDDRRKGSPSYEIPVGAGRVPILDIYETLWLNWSLP